MRAVRDAKTRAPATQTLQFLWLQLAGAACGVCNTAHASASAAQATQQAVCAHPSKAAAGLTEWSSKLETHERALPSFMVSPTTCQTFTA